MAQAVCRRLLTATVLESGPVLAEFVVKWHWDKLLLVVWLSAVTLISPVLHTNSFMYLFVQSLLTLYNLSK